MSPCVPHSGRPHTVFPMGGAFRPVAGRRRHLMRQFCDSRNEFPHFLTLRDPSQTIREKRREPMTSRYVNVLFHWFSLYSIHHSTTPTLYSCLLYEYIFLFIGKQFLNSFHYIICIRFHLKNFELCAPEHSYDLHVVRLSFLIPSTPYIQFLSFLCPMDTAAFETIFHYSFEINLVIYSAIFSIEKLLVRLFENS